MKIDHFKRKFIFLILLLGASQASFAACDQTLSSGVNLATAITNAAAGSTICLNSGTYAEASLSGISKTSDVTIQSVSGRTASVAFVIKNSNHLKFQNLTISKMDMRNGSVFNSNISVLNNTFKGQMLVDGSGKAGVNVNILVDGNTFDGINICTGCYTGRLQLWGITGVTITNNHFGGGGTADGILWGGYGGTVGPGNVFEGILQSAAGTTGAHIDTIQLNGGGSGFAGNVDHGSIVGNYFNNNTVHIGAYDGSSSINISNNVFGASDSPQPIQLGAVQGLSYLHNTHVGNWNVAQGAKAGMTLNSNANYQNNIFVGVKILDSGTQPGCSPGCTYDHNLFSSSSLARGTNNIIGLPTFSGGSNPTSWAGYLLTSSSLGYKVATDGNDMGGNYFGTGTVSSASLVAPSNLRAQ